MRIKALRTFNIFYEGKYYNAYEGEIKYWDTDAISYILNNFDDYIKILDQRYNEFRGTSSNDKPQYAPKYSLYLELDTGDFYYCESQGSKGSQEEKVVLEETTLDNWAGGANPNTFVPTMLTELPQTATIIWDGVSYDVTKETYMGMSYYGELGDNYNPIYSTYPFFLVLSNIPDEGDVFIIRTLEAVDHTIEIIAVVGTPDTDAVWKKVGSGGSEPESSGEKLFDGDVTTVEDNGVFMYEFSPMVALNYSSIIVEFDGTRYTVQDYKGGFNWYAFGTEMGYPFDEYPFGLVFGDNGNQGLATYIFTESSGTYSLKIWANSEEGEMPDPADPLR